MNNLNNNTIRERIRHNKKMAVYGCNQQIDTITKREQTQKQKHENKRLSKW